MKKNIVFISVCVIIFVTFFVSIKSVEASVSTNPKYRTQLMQPTNMKFASQDATIDSVNVNFTKPGNISQSGIKTSIEEWEIDIKINQKIDKKSLLIFQHVSSQEELSIIKKEGLVAISLGMDFSAIPIENGKVLSEDKPAQEFVTSFNVGDPGSPGIIGRVFLVGLSKPQKIEFYKYFILYENGQSEILPTPKTADIFNGYAYLYYNNICTAESNNAWCNYLNGSVLFSERFPLYFGSNFAQSYPLAYAILYAASFYFLGILIILLIFSYIFTLIFQRKPWGVIFDSKTLKPIDGAIIRIFDKDRNKLLETKVTGQDGRFTFLPGRGEFYINVTKPGYQFPSKILTNFYHPAYYHLYHGEEFLLKSDNAMFVTNIPLDPAQQPALQLNPIFFQRILFFLARARIILAIATFLTVLAFYLLATFVWWKSRMVNVNWLLAILIPFLLMEFYLWWNGRRVKVLKLGEKASAADYAAAESTQKPAATAGNLFKSSRFQLILLIFTWLLIATAVAYLIVMKPPFISNLFKTGVKKASVGVGDEVTTAGGEVAGEDFSDIAKYPDSVRKSDLKNKDSREITYAVSAGKDQVLGYYQNYFKEKGWNWQSAGEGNIVFTKEDKTIGQILIMGFNDSATEYKITYPYQSKK